MSTSLKNLSSQDVERLGLLYLVGKRINTPDNFKDVLQAVLDSVVDSLEAERGALFLVEAENNPELILSVDRSTDRPGEFSYSKTIVERVLVERQPVALVDAKGDESFASVASIQAQGIRSVICVPMLGRQSMLGLIYLDNRISNAFTASDLQMLDIISNFASTALERTRFSDALQSLNSSLEATVHERTQEAEEARDQAQRATQAKSLFIANMSHELRTPLNGVLGLTDDLLRQASDPMLLLCLEQIKHSAASLSTLVNGILDFSKLESGKVEPDIHAFRIEEVLKSTLATVAYSSQQKGLELIVELDPAVPALVEGDSTRLRQILINLLANAVKFTKEGWVKLGVKKVSQSRILFEVCDSGIGIAPDKQSMIFEPFSQADATTTRQYGGTGLGLSICQALTQLLGGRLRLESRPGQGSRFYFDIALKTIEEFSPPQLARVKVWVGDDQPLHRELLVKLLLGWGLEVVEQVEQCNVVITSSLETVAAKPCLHLVSTYNLSHEKQDKMPSDSVCVLRPVLRGELLTGIQECLNQVDKTTTLTKPTELTKPTKQIVEDYPRPDPPQGAVMLIAEDHEINQLVVLKMAESWGYRCLFADSGVEVVKLFSESRPRLILMDIEMPGIDGYAATQQIRALEERSGATRNDFVPILAATAHVAPDLRVHCLEAGLDDLVGKPLSRALLGSRLALWEQVLEGKLTRGKARYGGHKELASWPACFISQLHSTLSTLSIMLNKKEQSQLEEMVIRLERLSFASGLTQWGASLVNHRLGSSGVSLANLIAKFQQEWRTLAPTLLAP